MGHYRVKSWKNRKKHIFTIFLSEAQNLSLKIPVRRHLRKNSWLKFLEKNMFIFFYKKLLFLDKTTRLWYRIGWGVHDHWQRSYLLEKVNLVMSTILRSKTPFLLLWKLNKGKLQFLTTESCSALNLPFLGGTTCLSRVKSWKNRKNTFFRHF